MANEATPGEQDSNEGGLLEMDTHLNIEEGDMETIRMSLRHPSKFSFSVLGPYACLLQFSGLDLESKNRSKFKKYILNGFGISICLLVVWRFIKVMNTKPQAMSLDWLWACVVMAVALHGGIATLIICGWTYGKFIPLFEKQFDSIVAGRINEKVETDNRRRMFIFLLILSVLIASAWFLTSMHGFLYVTAKENNETNSSFVPFQYEMNLSNLWGLELLANFYMALSTILSTIICVTITKSLNNELLNFNEELKKESKDKTILPILDSFSTRHSEILSLIKTSNIEIQKLAGIGPVCSIAVVMFCGFILPARFDDLSLLFTIVLIFWSLAGAGLILFNTGGPSTTQQLIRETMEILVHDPLLQSNSDESIRQTYRVMMDRCQQTDTCIYLMGFVVIDRNFMKMILMVAPNIANLLAFIYKTTRATDKA